MHSELKDKGDKAKLDEVKKEVDALKELMKPEKRDVAAIKAKLDELNKKAQEVSTELYQKAAQAQQAEAAKKQPKSEGKKKDEKVVDADYKVKGEKDKKK